jgi:hypothetical protein
MADHAWCRDPSRDEAVRAAEDGRDRPLPTLEECIETAFAAGVRDSFREVEEAWAMIPKSVSGSSPVDQENKGNGMRTERVTLEVTHDDNDGHIQFRNWDQMLFGEQNGVRFPGESVRVVAEELSDAWAQRLARLTEERDAANRERDEIRQSWLRSEESGTRLLAERNAALDAADGLRKRVAELEAAAKGPSTVIVNGDDMVTLSEFNRHMTALVKERDAAIRERDNGRLVRIGTETDRDFARREKDAAIFHITELRTERDKLRVRVADLEAASGGGEQPRGWLTEEQRTTLTGVVGLLRDLAKVSGRNTADRCELTAVALDAILSRSSPPEVVLPVADCSWCSDYATVWRECLEAVRSSLAAAGVSVKEVGDE